MGDSFPEAESKENPMPKLPITSPYIHSRVDSNKFIIKWKKTCREIHSKLCKQNCSEWNSAGECCNANKMEIFNLVLYIYVL
jgi:hypothetical protein